MRQTPEPKKTVERGSKTLFQHLWLLNLIRAASTPCRWFWLQGKSFQSKAPFVTERPMQSNPQTGVEDTNHMHSGPWDRLPLSAPPISKLAYGCDQPPFWPEPPFPALQKPRLQ